MLTHGQGRGGSGQMRGVLVALTFLAVSFASGVARAAGPSHQGLLLRLALGFGGASTGSDSEPELELSGPAGFFSFDLGGSVGKGLALHGRLSAHSIVNPTVSLNGDELGDAEDTSLTLALLGVGLTYYTRSNLYLTAVAGVSSASLEVQGEKFDSENGFGLAADVGYEWPVGGDWGVGVAGRFEFHSIPEDDTRLVSKALGVLFSATYN